jgi:hypothetical protein
METVTGARNSSTILAGFDVEKEIAVNWHRIDIRAWGENHEDSNLARGCSAFSTAGASGCRKRASRD